MDTISTNSGNSKISDPHYLSDLIWSSDYLLLNLSDKINLKRSILYSFIKS